LRFEGIVLWILLLAKRETDKISASFIEQEKIRRNWLIPCKVARLHCFALFGPVS